MNYDVEMKKLSIQLKSAIASRDAEAIKETREEIETLQSLKREYEEGLAWEARNPGRRNDPRDEYPLKGVHY